MGAKHTKGLTAFQKTTLSDIGRGAVYQQNCGCAGWRIQGGNPSTVGILVSRGLARWERVSDKHINCRLTDEGRSAILSATGQTGGA